jgi:hypothetical protein
VSASDRGPEWAGHLLSPISFSDTDRVDCRIFPVGSKPSQLPDLILSGERHTLSQVPVDLAAWCRRESVKGGGRDGNDAENCVKGHRFSAAFPRIGSYCWVRI